MKMSNYTTVLQKNGTYLLHNSMMNSLIRVYDPQLQSVIDSLQDGAPFEMDSSDPFMNTLKGTNMIVDEAEDELATLNSLYFNFEHNSELHIMLIVTRRCNFRCAYCYEEYSNSDMTKEVFDNTKNFIIDQIQKNHYKNVYISFFGGEPSLMAREIVSFMRELLTENSMLQFPADIRAVMTTNGYLLSADVLDEFISCNIVRYQITLDGLEEDHNSSRYLANGQGTWKQIADNLSYFKHITDPRVSVLLRSNITPGIYEHIEEWLEYIHDNFSSPAFRIHFEAAKDYGKMNDDNFKLITNEVDIIMDIIDRSKKWGLPLELVGFKTLPFSMVCYAARQSSYIVDYNGEIKKCTSSSLDEPYNCVGQMTDKGMILNVKKAAQWTSYDIGERCKKCKILPLCYRKKCPVAKHSYDGCELLKKSYIKGLEYFYLTY